MKELAGDTSTASRILSALRDRLRSSAMTLPTLAACFIVAGLVLAAFLAQTALSLLDDTPLTMRADADGENQTRVGKANDAAAGDLRPVRLKKLESAALGVSRADPLR
jgi:hypothetical protein